MDVIGNNISNINTTGFKSSRVNFADMLSQTLTGASSPQNNLGGTNPKQIGLGSSVSSIDLLFTNGSVQSTGVNTDLCLSGNGLFVVNNGAQRYYTRNGDFKFDANGNYVQPGSGLFVQGWMADKDGTLSTTGEVGNITVPAGKSMEAAKTKIATFTNNLNADTEGYEISSIQVTKADGTTETVTDYNPNSYAGTIALNCDDGNTYWVKPKNTYEAGKQATFSVARDDSKIESITATGANQVELTVGDNKDRYVAVNEAQADITIPSSAISSGTYALDGVYGVYSVTKKISEVIAASDTTILLKFDDKTDNIESVTIPKPDSGTFKPGDSFTVTLDVTSGKATKGAIVKDSQTGNSVTIGATDGDATLGQNYEITRTIDSITRASGVSAVTITAKDGTKHDGLTGMNYSKGQTFYPSVVTTATAYGSEGSAHDITVLFTKTADNTWAASLKGGGTTATIEEPDNTTTSVSLTSSDIAFNERGKYVSGSATLTMKYQNGEEDQDIALDFSSLTQYAGSNTIKADADGNAAGTLSSISIDTSGIITGNYTNSKKRVEAQVAVAQFNNASGLTKYGDSLYEESNNSGTANIKTSADLGVTITPSALEMSNVDIANEFTDMIVTQRGFQSNSKIITVSDEMLETLVNLKR